jgi:hypothetical protein
VDIERERERERERESEMGVVLRVVCTLRRMQRWQVELRFLRDRVEQ